MKDNFWDILKYFALIFTSLSITYYAANSTVNFPVVLGVTSLFTLLYLTNKFRLLKKLSEATQLNNSAGTKDKSM